MTAIQLKDGTFVEPEQEQILRWQHLYPGVNVYQEINAMSGWCEASPTRRKTARGLNRFINSWLARAQQAGGKSPFAPEKRERVASRDMGFKEMLTDTSWAK
jgi:hypothetical protein